MQYPCASKVYVIIHNCPNMTYTLPLHDDVTSRTISMSQTIKCMTSYTTVLIQCMMCMTCMTLCSPFSILFLFSSCCVWSRHFTNHLCVVSEVLHSQSITNEFHKKSTHTCFYIRIVCIIQKSKHTYYTYEYYNHLNTHMYWICVPIYLRY